jgi:hypothetical protein
VVVIQVATKLLDIVDERLLDDISQAAKLGKGFPYNVSPDKRRISIFYEQPASAYYYAPVIDKNFHNSIPLQEFC